MAYKRQELIEQLLGFKAQHGRFPTRKDFDLKRIQTSKNAYYRAFGSLEKAIQQAECWERGELDLAEETTRRPVDKKPSSRCPFCGGAVKDVNDYYDTLPLIIVSRFAKLLSAPNGSNYSDAVLDCLLAIFGRYNKYLRAALLKEGLLDRFDARGGNA
jgi:hypothetical protein